jgi:hypothetical protein
MSYRAMADLVVVFHLAVVIFVVCGALLLFWRKWVAWVHLPVIAWVIFAECFHHMCPLTFLENWLRDRGGVGGYQGDFVAHYVMPVLYPDGLTERMQVVFGAFILILNLTLYLIAFRPRPVPLNDAAQPRGFFVGSASADGGSGAQQMATNTSDPVR